MLVASSVAEVDADAWEVAGTLPERDPEAGDLLDVYGGESLLVDGGALLRLWTLLGSGLGGQQTWSPDGARLLNLAVMQPEVNPAFGPLFWLLLAQELGPTETPSGNLVKAMGPMMYQLRYYPTLVPPAESVRSAQVSFLEELSPGSTDGGCAEFSDEDWSERCHGELERRREWVERNVYAHVYARIGNRELAPLG